LARWDFGHAITYYAHRIPNANNFQRGIGFIENGNIKEMGEVFFFTETEENKAIDYLEELKTKYIITDYQSVDILNGTFKSKIGLAQKNKNDYFINNSDIETNPAKFENSMTFKLHILDGRERLIEKKINGENIKFFINSLDHFRLIHESKIVECYKCIKKALASTKVFEYVKGARIIGKSDPNTEIILSSQIETNQGRKFVYQKTITTDSDGRFEFVVPYSTFGKEGRLSNQTQFDCFASPYKLRINDKEIEINVSEKDVLEGKMIEISKLVNS